MNDEPDINWTDVLSSRVTKVGYDAANAQLYVVWARGRTSVYHGVPADVADEFSKSWSVGEAVNSMLAPYRMTYA
jgi:hypothetical protein